MANSREFSLATSSTYTIVFLIRWDISTINTKSIHFPLKQYSSGCRPAHKSKEIQIGPIWRWNFVPGKRQRHSGILTQVSGSSSSSWEQIISILFQNNRGGETSFQVWWGPDLLPVGSNREATFLRQPLLWRLSLCFFIFLCLTMKNGESFQSCESLSQSPPFLMT